MEAIRKKRVSREMNRTWCITSQRVKRIHKKRLTSANTNFKSDFYGYNYNGNNRLSQNIFDNLFERQNRYRKFIMMV